MAAGVGTLGIDGPGYQLNERLEQLLLLLDQCTGLQRNSGRAGQGRHKRDLCALGRALEQ